VGEVAWLRVCVRAWLIYSQCWYDRMAGNRQLFAYTQ